MNMLAITPAPTAHQSQQLAAYAQLLRTWNPKINLVAPSTLPDLETRHIADSAQLVPFLPAEPITILDVGSGAGLPGLVLAILCPQHAFTLAERDQRKAAFLTTAAHTLGLTNVTIHSDDVLKISRMFDVITARAWASLTDILTLTEPLLHKNGAWLLLKGEAYQTEIDTYPNVKNMTFTATPSITNPKACVLTVHRNQVQPSG